MAGLAVRLAWTNRPRIRMEIVCAGLHNRISISPALSYLGVTDAVIPWASSRDCVGMGWLTRISKCPPELIKISPLNFF